MIVSTLEVQDKNTHIQSLKDEIMILKSRFEMHDTGHLRTAVSVLEERVNELESQVKNSSDRRREFALY